MTIERYDPFEGGLGFSLATRGGDVVHTSGMIGVDDAMNVAEDPADEFRQVLSYLGRRVVRRCYGRKGKRSLAWRCAASTSS